MLWSRTNTFELLPFDKEAELEDAISEVQSILFGKSRICLDVKKKIGAKGKKQNIPDGYLLDLASKKQPRLYVIEVELSKHEPLRHVALQILEFSLAFESEPQKVKAVLRRALKDLPQESQFCEEYAKSNGFDNLDYLLEHMIYKGGFWALVIIDELLEELESVLARKFKFGVDVLELKRYASEDETVIYDFTPFLADVEAAATGIKGKVDIADLDTIVVPAKVDGFEETFLGENRWHEIRIHGSMLAKIKYIAGYQSAPVSAVTHVAAVSSIEPWQDTSKYVVNFSEPAKKIGPLRLLKNGQVKAPQAPRYTSFARLQAASNLDEVF